MGKTNVSKVNWAELKQYCISDRELQVIVARAEDDTVDETAAKFGVSIRAIYTISGAVKARAARKGHAPEHDMTATAPDGFQVKGVSTYYNASGQKTGQWVKTIGDKERQHEIMLLAIEETHKNYKPFKPSPKVKHTDKDLLSLITITDFHLGMYAWEAETGDDWDVNISKRVFLNAIADMIEAAPKAHTGFLCQLGDFLHFDGITAVTPMSGHILDADTRYSKLVGLTIEIMTQAVHMMLKKFGKVVVVQAEGNHDMSGSIWLRKHIKYVFKDDKRVEVIDNEFPYYAYLHGEILLGFHHGHKKRMAQLPKLFASEPRFRKLWGQSTQAYIHTGHMHHERTVEDGGAVVEQHPTLSTRDSYSTAGGWVSARGAKVITYHTKLGEVHRTTVRPR
jgi:hypothetical protein